MLMGVFGTRITGGTAERGAPAGSDHFLLPSFFSAVTPVSLLVSRSSLLASPRLPPAPPRSGSCVLKPKDQTQSPPSTNASLVHPISGIAAECCA